MAGLRERRPEIEQEVFARVNAVADASSVSDPEYTHGLQAAVHAAIEHGLTAIEHGDDRVSPPPPVALLDQARRAARNGISLDTVLRHYFAGQAVIADFVVEEARRCGPRAARQLQRLLRAQAGVFDRLIEEVTQEHAREAASRPGSSEKRRVTLVKRLLRGEPVDTASLDYDLSARHVGVAASGPEVAAEVRNLAEALHTRLLMVPKGNDVVWAWLGGRGEVDPAEVTRRAAGIPSDSRLSVGEQGDGLAGWRLSHRQAVAALQVATHGSSPAVRYADVALLAAVLKDNLLMTSLRRMYVEPLAMSRIGAEQLHETIGAYFAAQGNATSAASALGVKRQTVTRRLGAIEAQLGRNLNSCRVELETALRLERLQLDHSVPTDSH